MRGNPDKVFLDANILIDLFDKERKYHEHSYKCFEYLVSNDVKIYTSSDIVTTVYYVLKKGNGPVLDYINKLSVICDLIGFSNNELQDAVLLMKNNGRYADLEDTLQYIMAKESGCRLIISNDKDFYAHDLEVISSKEFCGKFNI